MNTILLEIIAALGLAVATGLCGVHVGEKDGANRVQVAWDADKAAIVAEAIKAQAADTAQLLEAQARNTEIQSAYDAKLSAAAAAAAANGDLSDRLRRALGAPAHSCAVQQAGDQPGTDAASGVSPSHPDIDSAIAVVVSACQRDAAKLTALQGEIAPQL